MRFQHLISTQAKPARCPDCRRKVIAAIDAGLPARVEVEPVDAAEEIAAMLDGRWTYALLSGGGLVHRDASQIEGGLVGDAVHVEHRCPPRRRR